MEAHSFQVGTSELIGPEFTIPDPQELAKDFRFRSRSRQLKTSRLQIEFKVFNDEENLRRLFDARFCQDAKKLHAFHSFVQEFGDSIGLGDGEPDDEHWGAWPILYPSWGQDVLETSNSTLQILGITHSS